MRAQAGWAVTALVLSGAVMALAAPAAAASPATTRTLVRHISGTAGSSGQLLCGVTTRTKNMAGSISMVLHHAPAGQLLLRLQDAKNGTFFSDQKVINTGAAPTTLVSGVLTGTQFHLCAASPTGSPSGPYDADLTY